MASNHTPGPWRAHLGGAPFMVRDRHGRPVAECPLYLGPDIERANAALIAEAPAMLEALRALLQQCEYIASESPEAMQHPDLVNARAILARIDGEG